MTIQGELAKMPATEIASRIRSSDLSPVEVVDGFLERIEARNREVNAYVLVLNEEARRRARDAEKTIASGAPLGPLHGVPIAIKDLFDFKAGVPNTFGCKPFKDWAPTVSATYVTRLEDAGAIVLGKTNTPEFAGPPTTTSSVPPALRSGSARTRAARREVARLRWLRAWQLSPRGRTAAARSASPRRGAASTGSKPPSGASRRSRARMRSCSPCRSRMPVRSRGRSQMRR